MDNDEYLKMLTNRIEDLEAEVSHSKEQFFMILILVIVSQFILRLI